MGEKARAALADHCKLLATDENQRLDRGSFEDSWRPRTSAILAAWHGIYLHSHVKILPSICTFRVPIESKHATTQIGFRLSLDHPIDVFHIRTAPTPNVLSPALK